MDDMAKLTRRPLAQRLALLSLFPGIHIAHVPSPSNWELWRNPPDAPQQNTLFLKAA
jgi:hypothetical protein